MYGRSYPTSQSPEEINEPEEASISSQEFEFSQSSPCEILTPDELQTEVEILTPDELETEVEILTPDEILQSTPNELEPSDLRSVQTPDGIPTLAKLENLRKASKEEQINVLNVLVPQLSDLSGLTYDNFLSLVRLVGQHCSEDIKKEASFYRSCESRELENVLNSAVDILDKKLTIEALHVFFEACTGKSGRQEGAHRETIAGYQADNYEALLKGANLNTIPPYNFLKTSRMLSKLPSKEVTKQSLGGSYTMHQNLAPAKQLIDTKVGPLISDNAQRGTGKLQRHSFGKLDRSTPVNVVTHNIRAQSVTDRDDNSIFLDPAVAPWNHEFHALFRPVREDFFEVVAGRVEKDKEAGCKARNIILQHWIDEIDKDANIGNGMTSYEKISDIFKSGSTDRNICCTKCHTTYKYNVNSSNICPKSKCRNNPTFFEDFEVGPYKAFGFQENRPNSVIVNEVEPLPINPSGKDNLRILHAELKDKFWSEYASYPFYGDGLPGVTYERMKSEFVYCTTHEEHIQLVDSKLLAEHCKPECLLGN